MKLAAHVHEAEQDFTGPVRNAPNHPWLGDLAEAGRRKGEPRLPHAEHEVGRGCRFGGDSSPPPGSKSTTRCSPRERAGRAAAARWRHKRRSCGSGRRAAVRRTCRLPRRRSGSSNFVCDRRGKDGPSLIVYSVVRILGSAPRACAKQRGAGTVSTSFLLQRKMQQRFAMSRIQVEHFSEGAHGKIVVPQSIVKHPQQEVAFRGIRNTLQVLAAHSKRVVQLSGISQSGGRSPAARGRVLLDVKPRASEALWGRDRLAATRGRRLKQRLAARCGVFLELRLRRNSRAMLDERERCRRSRRLESVFPRESRLGVPQHENAVLGDQAPQSRHAQAISPLDEDRSEDCGRTRRRRAHHPPENRAR